MKLKRLLVSAIILILAASALAVDVSRPAILTLAVRDGDKPLPGVTVALTWLKQGELGRLDQGERFGNTVTAHTDAHGRAQLAFPVPSDTLQWQASLTLHKDGFLGIQESLTLFAGAQIEKTFVLNVKRQTVIRILDPQGRPVQGAPISPVYDNAQGQPVYPRWASDAMRTDASGICIWEHPPLPTGFSLTFRSRTVQITDGPAIDITLTQDEIESLPLTKTLEGTLLLSDGTPAVGWYVADPIEPPTRTGGTLYSYSAPRLLPVNRDGTFRISTASGYQSVALIVVSPEGVSQLFELDPRTWQQPTRRVTLTLPKTKANLQRQVLDEAGTPVAGLPIRIAFLTSNGRFWDFRTGMVQQGELRVDGRMLGPVTDAQGRFELPVPWGTHVQFGCDRPDGELRQSPDGRLILHQADPIVRPRIAPADMKDFAVVVIDEAGAPVSDLTLSLLGDTWDGMTGLTSSSEPALDIRGQHFFLPKSIQRVTLQVSGPGWKNWDTLVSLPGSEDHIQTVTLPASHRLKPIRGRLLDPAGNPVAGARITPTVRMDGVSGFLGGTSRNTPSATTDAQGRFLIPYAPDECALEVFRYNSATSVGDFPGWIGPTPVTPQQRDVLIRLQPAASIRILLPDGLTGPLGTTLLQFQGGAINDYSQNAVLNHSLADRALIAFPVRPGTYRIPTTALPGLGPLPVYSIVVQQGLETLLDWRNLEIPVWTPQPHRQVSVNVQAQSKAFSGAQVAVYTDQIRPEIITQCIRQWQSADTAQRAVLEEILSDAGATAREIIEPLTDEAALAPLRELLLKSATPWWYSRDGLSCAAIDLSADDGTIRFKGQVGRRYVAVAHVPGRWLGWQLFTLSASGDITLDLRPVRSLIANLPPWIPPAPGTSDGREVTLRHVNPSGLEARALIRMRYRGLSDNLPSVFELHRENAGSLNLFLDDLPVNAEFEIGGRAGWGNTPPAGRITITPGADPQVLTLPPVQ